jgi:hypothetical protein
MSLDVNRDKFKKTVSKTIKALEEIRNTSWQDWADPKSVKLNREEDFEITKSKQALNRILDAIHEAETNQLKLSLAIPTEPKLLKEENE